MAKRPLIFSGFFLYLNDKKIDIETFKQVLQTGIYTLTNVGKVEKHKLIYTDNYLKITFEDGAIGRRNPIVYNFNREEEEPNPRAKEQVEPKEMFALLDFKTSYMWVSNSKKKNSVIALLKSYFPTALIVAKDIYDEQQFIDTIKKLECIKVSAVPNLFSQTGILSDRLAEEINGYEATSATLSLNYNNTITSSFIIEKVKSIFKERPSLKSIVISGRDENNLGMLFNSDGFSRKIDIEAEVDDDEMFNQDDVFNKIINKIDSETT